MLLNLIKENLPGFVSELLSNDNYLILTHRRPDGDTLGSAAALCLALRKLGKTAFLAGNPEVTPKYLDSVQPYYADSTYLPETIVSVDISAIQQFEKTQAKYQDDVAFVIDHHNRNNIPFRKASFIYPAAAATGELIFYLIQEMGVELDGTIASLLYMAIATDTGCFKYANTTSDTHLIVAECIKTGFDLPALNTELFERKTYARFEIEKLVMQSMKFFADGKIAVILISLQMRQVTGATEDDIDDFSAIPRQIEGVFAGVSLYEQTDGSMKVSLRTNGSLDASKICGIFGGGGHRNAAGCTIKAPYEEAMMRINTEILKEL